MRISRWLRQPDEMDFRSSEKERESLTHNFGYPGPNLGGNINNRNLNINAEILSYFNKNLMRELARVRERLGLLGPWILALMVKITPFSLMMGRNAKGQFEQQMCPKLLMIYQLVLLGRITEHYENTKLECLWTEESTGSL